MNTIIIKSIAELLYDNDCVVIPEFGAFVSKDKSARLELAIHHISPPSREFVFDSQITIDDGLLVNFISDKQLITREQAVNQLHDFAMQSLATLETEKELRLEGIGKLYLFDKHNIKFVAKTDVDFCGDVFGLTGVDVKPIYRQELFRNLQSDLRDLQKNKDNAPKPVVESADNQEKKTQEVEDEHIPTIMVGHAPRVPVTEVDDDQDDTNTKKVTKPKNPKWYRAAVFSLIIAVVIVLAGWGVYKINPEAAAWNPLSYISPNEYIANKFNKKSDGRKPVLVIKLSSVMVKLPVVEYNPIITVREASEVKTIMVDLDSYSIIGASLDNLADAEACAVEFRKLGFADAAVLPINSNGKYRVEYETVIGREAAVERLNSIKENYDDEAWLLLKK